MGESIHQQPSVFVIMPFSKDYTWIYEEIIRPPLEESGFQVNRTDTEPHLELIHKRIVEKILSAKLVVAVINNLNPYGINPNVMYELGICHTFKKPTLLLVEDIERIPFDIRGLVCYQYPRMGTSNYTISCDKVRKDIKSVGQAAQKGTLDSGNPVTTLIPDVFKYIAPVNWLDKIKYSSSEIVKIREKLLSNAEEISAIEKRFGDLSSHKDSFWGRLKDSLNSIILAIVGVTLIKNMTESLVAINNVLPEFVSHLDTSITTLTSMCEYNNNLYEAQEKAWICVKSSETIDNTISEVVVSAESTLSFIEEKHSLIITLLPRIASMITTDYLGVLFGPVWVNGTLSTHLARGEISMILQRASSLSSSKDKLELLAKDMASKLER